MNSILEWKKAATLSVSRLKNSERLLIWLAAATTLITLPIACYELVAGHYLTGALLGGAPLFPMSRSIELLNNTARTPHTPR
jgi:hypothetical protein